MLNICALIFKFGVRSNEELQLILNDLGLKGSKGSGVHEAFTTALLARLDLINNSTEDAGAAMGGNFSKKMPLNMQLSEENTQCSNPKLVDVEWQTIYKINGKNINRLMQPRFLITLTLLCSGDFKTGGATETVAWSAKRNQLRIQRVKFESTFSEL